MDVKGGRRVAIRTLGVSASACAIGFFSGTLIALADPGPGWEAWRVGIVVGVILFLLVLFVAGIFFSMLEWA